MEGIPKTELIKTSQIATETKPEIASVVGETPSEQVSEIKETLLKDNIVGKIFGDNNFRDLGNLVPWGTKIIQNSASLVLPGAFLRKQNHNLFNALMFNSKEYIN